MSYRIAWYSEGKHLYTEFPCGRLPHNSNEYDNSCPGSNKPLFSRLNSSNYSLQRRVGKKSLNLSVFFFFFFFALKTARYGTFVLADQQQTSYKVI